MNNLLKPMITIIITFNGETTEMKVERQKYQQTIEALKLNYPNATIKTIDHYDLLSQIAEDFKINSHKVGLVYLLLDKDYKILYVGSSSNTGDKRLMQSDRMRSEPVVVK
ncbi:MAG: hypothetical protein E7A63_03650 [Clostridium butyricum]|nr:hypothetical protein [Clostridium butyricum]